MENARVVIIEDSELFRKMTIAELEYAGHQVVGMASTRQEAFNLVDRMAAGDVEADIILLDGNLEPMTDTYEDARQIAMRLKEAGVTTKILGFSLGFLSNHGIEVEADVGKQWVDVSNGIKAL